MPMSQNFNVANKSLNDIHENKILAKITEFKVLMLYAKPM